MITNNSFSIFTQCHKYFVFFGTEFILISLISLSVTSTKRLAARHFENFDFVIFTCR